MIAPLPDRRKKDVIVFLLLLWFLLAAPLVGRTALGATVRWVTPPPASLTSGQSFTVRWSVSGARSFDANVHWDPANPGDPGTPNGDISPTCDNRSTSCSTAHQGRKTSATLTAPTVSPTGLPVVVKYLVHIRVPAGGRTHAFTEARSVTINPPLEPPRVVIGPTTTGAIQVNATSNGAPWTGAINYTVTGAATLYGTTVPADFPEQPAGSYTLTYTSDGPNGAGLASIIPSPTQMLRGEEAIAFTLNFTSKAAPSTPTDLRVTAPSTTMASLAWKDTSSNEEGFTIERMTGTSGTYSQIATQVADRPFFHDSGLAAATTYCYRVSGYNASGDSGSSNEACATTPGISISGPMTGGGSRNVGLPIDLPGPGLSTTTESNSSYRFTGLNARPYRITPGPAWCGFAGSFPRGFRLGW